MSFFQKKQEENILQKKIEKGDNDGFVKLYDLYAPQIYRFIYLKTNSSHDSEDLTSEVFLRCWKSVNSGTSLLNPRAVIYQIARNLVVDYYRKKPQKELIIDDEKEKTLKNIPNPGAGPEENLALESDLAQIKKALVRLNPDYQDLILWHYIDDFSVKEISQVLEKPESAIRVQLHRALKSLRKELE